MEAKVDHKRKYLNAKERLFSDENICAENRNLFKRFFTYQERKLKRINRLQNLDPSTYKTLYQYVNRFKNTNKWFNNKPWKSLTKKDIEKVYNDLEDGIIVKSNGEMYKDRDGYYDKVFKSKPFDMAGVGKYAREVIEYCTNIAPHVRFASDEEFQKIVNITSNPLQKLLLWLSFDIGENVDSLLQLKKNDFYREINQFTKDPEYRVNLRNEILKRSRKARAEITIYSETVKLLDLILEDLKPNDYIFNFGYRSAKKFLDRLVKKVNAKCLPNGELITWKDFRSGMACSLLRKGWVTDEVNARLGHRPSSKEIDKYVDFLALDRHRPKQKVQQYEMSQLNDELQKYKEDAKLQAKRREEEKNKANEQMIQMVELLTESLITNSPKMDQDTLKRNEPIFNKLIDLKRHLMHNNT